LHCFKGMRSSLALLWLTVLPVSTASSDVWMGGSPTMEDLWNEYNSIFPSGNRNAASHRWASFILERSSGLPVEVIQQLFRSFCAVSGSPVTPSSAKRYKYSLARVDGVSETGFVYHCCKPCVCDTQEFIRLDTKTLNTSSGPHEFTFQVIGNPCSSASFASIYHELWPDPFRPGQKSSLALSAPDVNCGSQGLQAAVMSDHGNIIVGMMLHEPDDFEDMSFTDVASRQDLAEFCHERKKEGYNSGMGLIFAKVANITRPSMLSNASAPAEVAPAESTLAAANTAQFSGSPHAVAMLLAFSLVAEFARL